MSIIRKVWLLEEFSNKAMPMWPCPTCVIGRLNFNKDWVKREPNSYTKLEEPSYLHFYPEAHKEHFAGIITCSNKDCQESVALCGIMEYKTEYDYNDNERVPYRAYKPKFFYPSLNIFPVATDTDPEIRAQILKSFSHFFNDSAACANAIRTSLELILNDQGINKQHITNNKKRKAYSLHQRIEMFGKINKDLEPFLLAAKWIGNAGSHTGEVSKEALLDGYDLIEHCIDELYLKKNRLQLLKNKAKEINKRKKPIPIKKK